MLHYNLQNKSKRRSIVSTVVSLAVLAAAPNVLAQSPANDEAAFEIAARSDRSDRGFRSSRAELTMTLRNAAGKETSRALEITTLEVEDEKVGDKTLVVFSAPRDIDGTALLSHANILAADDQWLYLPSVKRVKRISTANKSGPFVGSEFAFEDMTGQELNKYSYTYLEDRPCGDLMCDLVERTPRYEGSAYSRQIAWIDQTAHQIRKVEYFDRKDDVLKTLEYSEYREYAGVWRAHLMSMQNHQTGKATELRFGDYQFGLDLSDKDFSKGVLSRLR